MKQGTRSVGSAGRWWMRRNLGPAGQGGARSRGAAERIATSRADGGHPAAGAVLTPLHNGSFKYVSSLSLFCREAN